ncbi:DUF4435 domain-containing protein [Pseudomonas sp. B329]|uniref:DUF4435 domain-containing protein n=1 Tax=Pseudomonas sp. B329 TaxID=1553459 RepID=UPI002004CFD1|nr:DUF4435 domain-containing protein [Pseudomonas sp. B329]MCK3864668.1 DUF4435 domain-containing protein [Pseudomonas sp. B329]
MTTAVDNLRAARQTPYIALQQYILLRSNASDDFICVFEGWDDYPYYDTIIKKVRENFKYQPLIVKGKDQVLGLRELLSKRNDAKSTYVAYFIDRDYDGYKSHAPSANTYCTDGYSIENNLYDDSILPELLMSDYQCVKTEDEGSIPGIILMFNQRMVEFQSLMREANKIIYYARNNNIRLSSIENQITKYININLDSITINQNNHHLNLIGWPEEIDPNTIPNDISEFRKFTPLKDWRGKFVLGTYIELLHKLKDDRCAINPRFFGKKAPIKFNPKSDILRTLAILSPVPECLRKFTLELGKPVHTTSEVIQNA